jgi:hypothetical protein
LQHSRPSSVVHQQHHSQTPAQQQPPAQQHSGAYTYPQQNQASNSQDHGLPYYAHPSPYSTPGATSGYTSAGEFFLSLFSPPLPFLVIPDRVTNPAHTRPQIPEK